MPEIIFEKLTVEEEEKVRGGDPIPIFDPVVCDSTPPDRPCTMEV